MRSAVKDLAVWGAACAIVAAAPAPAAAEEGGEGGWVPSLAVTGGAMIQRQTSSVGSFCADGGPGGEDPEVQAERLEDLRERGLLPCDFSSGFPPNPDDEWFLGTAPLRPADSDEEWAVSPFVGFDLQLMTPTIPRIPGRPRLFARGEILLAFGSTRNTASEAEPSGIRVPLNNQGVPLTNPQVSEASLLGAGSRTASEIQTLVWGAGAGIAFPFRVRGRQLWVKPGAAWTRYTIDVEGIVEAGIKNDPWDLDAIPVGPNRTYGDLLRVIPLSGERSKTYDGIGPSLEIEMDVGRFGPIGASLFVGGGAYRILGDRSIRFESSLPVELQATELNENYFHEFPADTYTAKWSYEVDRWLYRGSVGLRLSWLGK